MSDRPESKPRFSKLRVALILAGLLCGSAWYLRAPLFCFWGRMRLEADPVRAEELLEQSFKSAGGAYPRAQVLHCRALGKQGRWLEALGYFSVIENPAEAQPELLQLGLDAVAARQFALAERALTAGVVPGASEAEILRALIPLQWNLGRPNEVLSHCQRLTELTPEDSLPYDYSGRVYEFRQSAAEAARAFQAALERHPDDPGQLRRHLIAMYLETGDVTAAHTQVDLLLQESSRALDAQLYLAFVLRLEGKTEAALAAVTSVVESKQAPPQALQLRGVLYLDRRDYESAVADLAAVVEQMPANREAHYKLAEAYRKLGNSELAAKHLAISSELTELMEEAKQLEQVAAQELTNVEVRRRLATLHDRLRNTQDAQRWRSEAAAAVKRQNEK